MHQISLPSYGNQFFIMPNSPCYVPVQEFPSMNLYLVLSKSLSASVSAFSKTLKNKRNDQIQQNKENAYILCESLE